MAASTDKHIEVNLISAVTAAGALPFAVYGDTFDAACSATSAPG